MADIQKIADIITANSLTGTAAEIRVAINAKNKTRHNPLGTTWSNKGIDAAFPSDFLSGQIRVGLKAVIAARQAEAATAQGNGDQQAYIAKMVEAETFSGYLDTMAGPGLDFANAALRAQLDALQNAGVLSADCVAKVKGMAIQTVSLADEAGIEEPTEQDISDALPEVNRRLLLDRAHRGYVAATAVIDSFGTWEQAATAFSDAQ